MDGSLDINPIPLTITADSTSKSYGQELTFAGTEFTTSTLLGSDSVTSVTLTSAGAAATAPVAGSPYSITPSAAVGNGLSNYTIQYVDGSLEITSALLTVTADPQAITYGDPDPAFTFQYSGFAGLDDATVLTNAPTCTVNGAHTNAGDYTITCNGGSDDNYSFQYNDNTLTIHPLAITVTAVTDIKEYDGNTSSTGTPIITLGTLVGDDTADFSQAFETASAGTGKTLLPTGNVLDGNNGNNYTVNFINNTSGEITRRPITVSADPQSKPFGSSDPVLSYSVTNGSLLGNDGFSGALTRDPGESVGAYTIRQGDLSAGNNYALSFVENTLTITIVNQTITILTGAPATAANGSSFNVEASASSNLDVAITVEGFCTGSGLNSATITMNTGVGICTIHYNQGGNENFNPAVELTETTAGIEGPLVTLHPTNALVMTGGTASFSAAASGNPAPGVVWQVSSDNGATYTDLVTETNTTLTVTAQTTDHGKKYRAVFTNSAGSATTDPATLTIDDTAPTVITGGINSIPDTGDAKIDELEIVTVGLTQLLVTFSEDVNNWGEGLGKHDVTNPANYMLVKDNGDGIQTVSCSVGIAGNDTPITVDSVTYTNNNGSGPFVASLTLNGGNILSNGVYRLLVCGSTSITDLAGNHLAGNGSTPSTDFPRGFVMATTETGSGGGGSGSGGSGSAKKTSPSYSGVLIPVTGFAPSQASFLPVQPLNLSYAPYSGLIIEIPSLGVKVDIVGVPNVNDGWDVTWLGNNAGYLSGSAFPTTRGNSVITAHVWNANNTAGTFFNLKSLKYGDKILIHAWGQVYTYEVRSQSKLQPTDLATVMSHEDLSWVTLVTCENYSEKSDKYVYRRVVKAVLVSVTADK